MRTSLAMLAGVVLAGPVLAADVFDVDSAHTTLGFSAKHMVVSSVKGKFDEFKGSFEIENGDATTLKASATAAAKSVNTGNQKRDDHLRSADFFDAEKYPDVKFESTSTEQDGDHHVLHGNLTIKDVTKEIAIPIEVNGPIQDPWGNTRYGFEGSTTINRQDWNVAFANKLESGELIVSDNVRIDISVEGIKRK